MKIKTFVFILFLMSIMTLVSKEISAQFLQLDIENRNIKVFNCESLWGVKTIEHTQNNTLDLQFLPIRNGNENRVIAIPHNVDKIKLFNLTFPLLGNKGYFRGFELGKINPPWYSFAQSESLELLCMIFIDTNDKRQITLKGRFFYCGKSNSKKWSYPFDFDLIVMPDGQIFNSKRQTKSNKFINKNGKLYFKASAPLRHYKSLVKKQIPLPINLPK